MFGTWMQSQFFLNVFSPGVLYGRKKLKLPILNYLVSTYSIGKQKTLAVLPRTITCLDNHSHGQKKLEKEMNYSFVS